MDPDEIAPGLIVFAWWCLKFVSSLTIKVPIKTAADNKLYDIFPNFRKEWYFIRIVCQQTNFIKYHALFVIFEKEAKFENAICCKF